MQGIFSVSAHFTEYLKLLCSILPQSSGIFAGMIFQIFIVPVLFVVFQWLQEKFKPMEWDSLDESEVEAEIEQYSPNTHK